MLAVIMQPTYLPWLGYFDLIDLSDVFVFLDTVQFSRQSWQQRNRIKSANGPQWLTVPVLTHLVDNLTIRNIRINNRVNWREKHVKTIRQNYGRAPRYAHLSEVLEEFYGREHEWLADLNIRLILTLKDLLGIETRCIRSSELDVSGGRVELLIEICRAVGASKYLSPRGSREYIDENNIFAKREIELAYHRYGHPEYPQLYGGFISHMSVIDLIFNTGEEALDIIRRGRR